MRDYSEILRGKGPYYEFLFRSEDQLIDQELGFPMK